MNTAVEVERPTAIGLPYAGGFYAGQFRIGDDLFALVVAPKADGEHDDTPWNKTVKMVADAGSLCDGHANTLAMAKAGSALAKWAIALRIGQFDDWYLPSRDELELLYRHFKPGTGENWVYRHGDNPSSVPPGYPYSETLPGQTSTTAFRKGGAEAFNESWYWSSSQSASTNDYAWFQGFNGGFQDGNRKLNELRARAVRRWKRCRAC
jgi:hypothetical protein